MRPAARTQPSVTEAKPTGPPWRGAPPVASPAHAAATWRTTPGAWEALSMPSCTRGDGWKACEEGGHKDLGPAKPSPGLQGPPPVPPARRVPTYS